MAEKPMPELPSPVANTRHPESPPILDTPYSDLARLRALWPTGQLINRSTNVVSSRPTCPPALRSSSRVPPPAALPRSIHVLARPHVLFDPCHESRSVLLEQFQGLVSRLLADHQVDLMHDFGGIE